MVPRFVGFVVDAAGRQVKLAPDDRLHALLARGGVELRHAIQIAMIGNCYRRDLLLLGAVEHRIDSSGSVEQRVLRVAVQMAKFVVHRAIGSQQSKKMKRRAATVRKKISSTVCVKSSPRGKAFLLHPQLVVDVAPRPGKTRRTVGQSARWVPVCCVVFLLTNLLFSVLYLLYLDTEHVSDPLFLEELARQFHEHPVGHRRALIVHGSSEKVERTFESDGVFMERENGLLPVETEEQRRLVERDVRETNQSIVASLTDQVVPTVGIQGTDRHLLHRTSDGAIGAANNLGWLDALLKQHVIAVVSTLIPGENDQDIAEEVPLSAATTALASYFASQQIAEGQVQVVAFSTGDTPGLTDSDGSVIATLPHTELPDDALPHPELAPRLLEAQIPLLLTNLSGFFQGDRPTGTQIEALT